MQLNGSRSNSRMICSAILDLPSDTLEQHSLSESESGRDYFQTVERTRKEEERQRGRERKIE